jgi:hypothetical protein
MLAVRCNTPCHRTFHIISDWLCGRQRTRRWSVVGHQCIRYPVLDLQPLGCRYKVRKLDRPRPHTHHAQGAYGWLYNAGDAGGIDLDRLYCGITLVDIRSGLDCHA